MLAKSGSVLYFMHLKEEQIAEKKVFVQEAGNAGNRTGGERNMKKDGRGESVRKRGTNRGHNH